MSISASKTLAELRTAAAASMAAMPVIFTNKVSMVRGAINYKF